MFYLLKAIIIFYSCILKFLFYFVLPHKRPMVIYKYSIRGAARLNRRPAVAIKDPDTLTILQPYRLTRTVENGPENK